jgi:hypothetical protein
LIAITSSAASVTAISVRASRGLRQTSATTPTTIQMIDRGNQRES